MKTFLYLLPLVYLMVVPAVVYTLWGPVAALASFWLPVLAWAFIWSHRHFK